MIYSIIPVHGISVAENYVAKSGDTVLWGITNPSDISFYKEYCSDYGSLEGNLQMISKRLNPHSFVFALNPKIASDVWNDYHTELLLSALSLRLNYDRIHAKGQAAVPVYRKRFNELADLPISFKKTGIHSVGHTGRIGMMTWEPKQLTHEDIKELVDSSPKILNAIFNYKNEGSNDDRNNLLSYIRVFDNINTGAFIASELTVIEQLLIDNGNWKELKSKVEFLFKNKQSDITQLFKERHEYIHQGLLPDNDAMTVFAFEVLTFVLMKKLQFYDSFPEVSFKKFIDVIHYVGKEKRLLDLAFDIEPPKR